uniref:Uncharacterized protein n=2 Tax=Clytia hemisphaerica TaxID=252671 RepID=A0A7M5VEP9_9CNID
MRIHSLHSLHVLTKLSVSVPRVPCDESTHPVTTSEVKRPSVKRHKLGTTTISNLASKTSEELAKMNGNSGHVNEEISPLSESLKKLQEINEEIRRLRSLSYKENVDQVRTLFQYSFWDDIFSKWVVHLGLLMRGSILGAEGVILWVSKSFCALTFLQLQKYFKN